MTICQLDESAKCSVCGRVAARADVVRECRPAGLGDMVAAGLSAIGITKERVEAVVGGDCGCRQRQEALNRLGRKLGVGGP